MPVLSRLNKDLPDLCLLAIISQMNLKDRLAAHQVCPRWYYRVREVNTATSRLLTIIIASESVILNPLENQFSLGNIIYEPSVSHLINFKEEFDQLKQENSPLLFQPLFHLTHWNHLQFEYGKLTRDIVLKIMTAFPGTTELCFLAKWSKERISKNDFDHLVTMLTTSGESESGVCWKNQLTSLRVFCSNQYLFPGSDFFKALNGLTALKNLDLDGVRLGEEKLPILRQLNKMSLRICNEKCHQTFVYSLLKYGNAQEEGQFQVNLAFGHFLITTLLKADENIRKSLIRLNQHSLNSYIQRHIFWPVIKGRNFPNLVSLLLYFPAVDCRRVFKALGRNFKHLQHLSISISFIAAGDEQQEAQDRALSSPILADPIQSVRALDLDLYGLRSHSQFRWLNIGGLVPNVRTIYLSLYYCFTCSTLMKEYWARERIPRDTFIKVTACLRDLVGILVSSTRLPPERIIYQKMDIFGSPAELLAAKDDPL